MQLHFSLFCRLNESIMPIIQELFTLVYHIKHFGKSTEHVILRAHVTQFQATKPAFTILILIEKE